MTPPEPDRTPGPPPGGLADDRLAEIRGRLEKLRAGAGDGIEKIALLLHISGDASDLLAEVERLRGVDAAAQRLNQRRLDLIDKKYKGGLTEREAAELDALKRVVAEWVNAIYPRECGV